MNSLVFEGGVVTPSKLAEAQDWLSSVDGELRSTAPEGTTYIGVYARYSAQKSIRPKSSLCIQLASPATSAVSPPHQALGSDNW